LAIIWARVGSELVTWPDIRALIKPETDVHSVPPTLSFATTADDPSAPATFDLSAFASTSVLASAVLARVSDTPDPAM
jgi:hypothetical protein